MDYKKLFNMADKAKINAYVPFSRFKVGAALLCESGKVYIGVNVENSSYGATICAERTAFVTAIAQGERTFTAIAIASSGGEALPCGICRQFMYEFGEEIDVITGENTNSLRVQKVKDLLPEGFRL
ncbi:MAG: cytidine deaminase [Anaerovoracaceae bacterium]